MSLYSQTILKIQPLDEAAMQAARERQAQLTKPAGSLGRLEEISIQLAGITGQPRPRFGQPAVITMAADHGVALQGVSAYPREVTPQMVLNFLRGGAAINVLARHVGAHVVVVDMGIASDLAPDSDLVVEKIALGTRDLSKGPAMTRDQAQRAVEAGIRVVMREMERGADTVATRDQAHRAVETGIRVSAQEMGRGADMLATGDMGIGNTTASSAIVAALTGRPVAEVTGRGTGVDDAGLTRKVAVIERALEVNRPDPSDGWDVLSKVGGFEIGGLAGVMLGAAAQRTPVVIDGFISGAAAMIACTLAPQAQPYLIAAHRSVEIGHRVMLEHLRLKPLFDLDLRLGEGTGAALGISLCLAACKVLDEMATFGEAGVAGRDEGR